jgi:hypothetical protein
LAIADSGACRKAWSAINSATESPTPHRTRGAEERAQRGALGRLTRREHHADQAFGRPTRRSDRAESPAPRATRGLPAAERESDIGAVGTASDGARSGLIARQSAAVAATPPNAATTRNSAARRLVSVPAVISQRISRPTKGMEIASTLRKPSPTVELHGSIAVLRARFGDCSVRPRPRSLWCSRAEAVYAHEC